MFAPLFGVQLNPVPLATFNRCGDNSLGEDNFPSGVESRLGVTSRVDISVALHREDEVGELRLEKRT